MRTAGSRSCRLRGEGTDAEGTVPTTVPLQALAAPDSRAPAFGQGGHTGRVFHNGQLPHARSQGDTPRTIQRQVESLIFRPLLTSRADT